MARNKFFDFPFLFFNRSYPEVPKGASQYTIRSFDNSLKNTISLNSSIVYSEQVGKCRQVFGKIGEIAIW